MVFAMKRGRIIRSSPVAYGCKQQKHYIVYGRWIMIIRSFQFQWFMWLGGFSMVQNLTLRLWTFGVSGEFRSLERLGHRLSEYWPFRERRTLFLWYRAIVEGPLWVWRRLCHWERTLKTMIEGEWKNEMKGIEIHRNEIHHISQDSPGMIGQMAYLK